MLNLLADVGEHPITWPDVAMAAVVMIGVCLFFYIMSKAN